MKKMWLLLLVAMAALVLTACQKEYAVDGEFTAYETSVSHNAPQVTMVTVTIEKGKIAGFNIDVIQGSATDSNDDGIVDTFAFNAESKKDLGYAYHMHYYTYAATDDTPTEAEYQVWLSDNDKLEWFEQAEVLETYFLENGVDEVPVVDGEFDGIAGVTISDANYVKLAQDAVALAKAGKFQSIYVSADDIYVASMTVAKGEFSELSIDVLQGSPVDSDDDGIKETFAFNANTKQELGLAYHMHYSAYAATDDTPTDAEYETWLAANDKLEWFQQIELITDYVTENGWNGDLEPLNDRQGTVDGTNVVDDLAGASIRTGAYYDVLAALFEAAGDSVK